MLPTLLAFPVQLRGRVRPENRAGREKETGKENVSWKGEQGGANEWTTGLTAAECTAGPPTILRYRAIHRYGAKPTRSLGERGLYAFATVGRQAVRDERVGRRE